MAFISYAKLWRSDVDNNVSAENGVLDINLNFLKLKVKCFCKKTEKITTNFELLIKKMLQTKVT